MCVRACVRACMRACLFVCVCVCVLFMTQSVYGGLSILYVLVR